MADCMALTRSGQMPTLLAMAHQPDNREAVTALVALNIAALDEYLHLNNRLSNDEVDTIAHTIIDTYGGALSFADINLIITNAKIGRYGRFYERLSSADILSWFDHYYNDRLSEAATQTLSDHEYQKRRTEDDRPVNTSNAAYLIYKEQIVRNNYQIKK